MRRAIFLSCTRSSLKILTNPFSRSYLPYSAVVMARKICISPVTVFQNITVLFFQSRRILIFFGEFGYIMSSNKGGDMNTPNRTEDWPIYNCHVHTFTRTNSPKYFILWALSDSKLGKINGWKIPLYLLYVASYFALLFLVARATFFLSARSDLVS